MRASQHALAGIIGVAGVMLTVFLFIPDIAPTVAPEIEPHPFSWDRAQLFAALQQDFVASRSTSLEVTARRVDRAEAEGSAILEQIEHGGASVPWDALARLESLQFDLAVRGAAHVSLLPRVHTFIQRSRIVVMRAARGWPVDRADVHEAIYRVIYGGRTALEEALVQTGSAVLAALEHLDDIPAATPSVEVMGVRVHSGDMLLSRGGAPTSALIARGSDFPGNFSHVALVHVERESGEATVIEALIERGTVLSTPKAYLESKKHRILLLRLRPDHPVLRRDPLAPHKAATTMLERVRAGAVPYDFSMDWNDPEAFFCSEVAYHAYRAVGIDLWAVQSDMSAPGLVQWLGSMGVRQFTTLVPSDLEYDPRLGAVAEWRNVAGLRRYRFDNVILDVLLEGADQGDRLGYAWFELPAARLLKAWSVGEALLGGVPTIPSGMSASTALKVNALTKNVHPVLYRELEETGARFRAEHGYDAPYWVLMDLARAALADRRPELPPALRAPATQR